MIAVVAGGSGAVGQHLLRALPERFERVISLGRRQLGAAGVDERIVDFDQLEPIEEATHAFCALGTTMKKAGSKAAFTRVDHDFVLSFADALPKLRSFSLVSSVGASATSRNFYLRTKGEVEQDLAQRDFRQLIIAQPSMLLTPRQEGRPGEAIGQALTPLANPLLIGGLRRYRGIEAKSVGYALASAWKHLGDGKHILHYDRLMDFAPA